VAKLTHVWVCCAVCDVRSVNIVDDLSPEGDVILVREGWMPAIVCSQKRWFCAVCAQTPSESRVLVALRVGA
jgi:hypothetical protein